MSIDLRNELRGILDETVAFETNWRTLCSLKDRGVKADDVQAALDSMYQENHNERCQDRIADLLDCVVRWCSSEFAVWSKR